MDSSEPPTPGTERSRIRTTLEALEVARARELSTLTDQEAFRIMASLRLFAAEWRGQPEESGLLEQQRLFQGRTKSARAKPDPAGPAGTEPREPFLDSPLPNERSE
ncbi:MAG: hypothetical protein KF791_03270 [Verrucomicrobiae bacterium]|nr:hypothetical protein [Verrucomicrobiae bacterium]